MFAAVVKLIAGVLEFFLRQQLFSAGRDQEKKKTIEETLCNVDKAADAQKSVTTDPDGTYASGVRDKYTRLYE